MGKRRVIYYSDARHYHMYVYDPPMRVEDACAPVDEAAGTSANTFAYGFGVGPTIRDASKTAKSAGLIRYLGRPSVSAATFTARSSPRRIHPITLCASTASRLATWGGLRYGEATCTAGPPAFRCSVEQARPEPALPHRQQQSTFQRQPAVYPQLSGRWLAVSVVEVFF